MNVFMQQKIKLYIILMATLMLAGQFQLRLRIGEGAQAASMRYA